MTRKAVLAITAILALALAAVAMAAPAPYKVTGGGQTFANGDIGQDGKPTVQGPGNTISFQASIAQQGESPASGSVNIIDRSGGGGHFKGTVECAYLASNDTGGGYAELRGHGRKGNSTTDQTFLVRIMDNGQGAAADNDMVEFDTNNPPLDCSNDTSGNSFSMTLGRGNATIHKVNPSTTKSNKSSKTSTTSTTSLTSLKLGL
jgi:hypothetical protein